MPAAPSSKNSTLVVVLATAVLMLISGVGGFLAFRDSSSSTSGGGVELGPLAGGGGNVGTTTTAVAPGSSVVATSAAPAGYLLDTPAYTIKFPVAPSATDTPTAWNGVPVPGTQWALADAGYTLYASTFDYSAAAAVAGFDVQQVLDSVVVSRAPEGSTVVANESITVGTDMGRRAQIQAADHAVVLTAVFHGTTLAVVQVDVAAGDPPVAYTTAVASLIWK